MNIIGAGRYPAWTALLSAILFTAACATMPDDTEDAQLAKVRVTYPIEIISVNGQKVDRLPIRAWKQPGLELQPGSYHFVVRHGASYDIEADDPRVVAGGTVTLEANLEAGHVYRIVSTREDGPEPVIRIQDVTRKRWER